MGEKKYQILLVEDELYIRELYERILKEAGFDVISAEDGKQGLDLAQKIPDLILLDIMMPALNGIELLKKLKADEKTKNISIVLLTNLGQESIIRQAMEHGVRGYMMKMRVSPYDIVNEVREFLTNPNHTTDLRTLELE